VQRVFDNINIRINLITGNEIQWSLLSSFKEKSPYNFIVQASSTFDFSEVLYSIPAGDNFYVIDDSNIKQSWSKDLLYRIQLITGSNNTYYSEILSFDSAPTTKRKYRMSSEIMRKNTVWFKFAGYQGYLLKRKSFGQIDTTNVDPITGVPLNNNIGNFGTGLVGGYYNPLPVSYVVESNTKDKQQAQDGMSVKELYELVVRTQGFPYIENKDILINAETNKRYLVDGMASINFPGTEIYIMQKLSIKLLPITDPIYKISAPSYKVSQTPLSLQPNP
jgi:hypothetical protein